MTNRKQKRKPEPPPKPEVPKVQHSPGGIKGRWLVNSLSFVLVILAVVVILISVGVSGYYYATVRDNLASRAATTSDTFRKYFTDTYDQFYTQAEATVTTFQDQDKFEQQFLDANGRILLSTSGLSGGGVASTEDASQALSGQKTAVFTGRDPLSGERVMSVTAPLLSARGDLVGGVRYITSLRIVERQIWMIVGFSLLACLLFSAIQLIQNIIVSIALVIIHISPYGRQRIPQNPAQVGYRAVTTEKIDSRLLRTNGIVLLLQKSLLPVVLQQAPGTSGHLRLHALRPEQSLVITCRKILTEITVEHEIPTLLRFGSLRDKRFFRFGRRNIIGMFGQPSLLDGVDPGRDLRTESLGREHFAFERENLSAVSLLCGRIFPQHRTQSCNPGLHLVDPDLQPTVLIPKRNVFRIRLQGRNTGPRRVGSSSHDNDREGQK